MGQTILASYRAMNSPFSFTAEKELKPSLNSPGASSAMPVDCCPHYVLSTEAGEIARWAGMPMGLGSKEMPGQQKSARGSAPAKAGSDAI
ncbi:hypothetical protein [Rhizobium phaseoli]|uniref:hypothetical protein n=1 Tax=Rhizobium phaseoli TaxID=396 RepID=UPI0011424A41|nr:hypothetical protein [Rhizobium phaseoli]